MASMPCAWTVISSLCRASRRASVERPPSPGASRCFRSLAGRTATVPLFCVRIRIFPFRLSGNEVRDTPYLCRFWSSPPQGVSEHPELETGRFGHHGRVPDRVPDQLDLGRGDAGHLLDLLLHLARE